MKTLVFVATSLLAVVGPKPEVDRDTHRESSGWEHTNFNCVHSVINWENAGYQVTAEGAVFISDQLLPESCDSVIKPNFMLTFNPPMRSIIVLELVQGPDINIQIEVECWNSLGDVVVFGPDKLIEPGMLYTEGHIREIMGPSGTIACRTNSAIADLIIFDY